MVITIKNLSTGELEKVKGGGITILGSLGIAALVIFICGVIEGITNPTFLKITILYDLKIKSILLSQIKYVVSEDLPKISKGFALATISVVLAI